MKPAQPLSELTQRDVTDAHPAFALHSLTQIKSSSICLGSLDFMEAMTEDGLPGAPSLGRAEVVASLGISSVISENFKNATAIRLNKRQWDIWIAKGSIDYIQRS